MSIDGDLPRGPGSSGRRAPDRALLAILAAFTAVELFVLLKFSRLGDLAVESDFLAEIAPAARHLAAGQLHVGDYPFKGPVSAVVLAIGNAMLGPLGLDAFRVGTVISLLAALGSLWLVHRLGLTLWGRRAALAAVGLTAFQNVFFVNAHKAGSDQLFLLVTLAAVHLGLQPAPRGCRRLLGLGALGGLAFLTRYIGVVVPVWLAAAVVFGPAGARRTGRGRAASAGAVLAGALLVTLPWFVVNLVQTGAPLTQQNLQNTVQAFYPEGAPAAAAGSLADLIAAAPARFAAGYVANLADIARGDFTQVLGAALALAMLAGLALAVARRDRRTLLLVALGALYVAAYGFVFYVARFSLPLVPIHALLAASLLERRAPRWLPLAVGALLAVGCAQQVHLTRGAVRFYHGQEPEYLRPSLAFLRDQTARWTGERPPRLMARKPHAAWYGGMDFVPYPAKLAGAPDLLERARAAGADFLCAGKIERAAYHDTGFLDRLDTYDGVQRVFAADGNTIYRLGSPSAPSGANAAPPGITDAGTQVDSDADRGAVTAGATGTTGARDKGERSAEVSRAQAAWQSALAAGDAEVISAEGTRLIRVLDHDGRVREALAVATRMLESASRGDEPLVRLYVAQACLKLGETSRGLDALEPHLELFDAVGRPQELARAEVVIARLHENRGERKAALDWARRAQARYRQAGLAREAAALDALVERLAGPAR